MSRRVHVRVVGIFDMASRPQIATVTINRDAGIFSVRPLRRRRSYDLPLATVAEHVVRSLLRADVAAKRAARGKRRRR